MTDLNLQLSKHFKAKEFQCHDGSPLPDIFPERIKDTVEFMERLRGFINFVVLERTGQWKNIGIYITSGHRSPEYMKKKNIKDSGNHSGCYAGDTMPTKDGQHYYYKYFTYEEYWEMTELVDKSFPDRSYRLGRYDESRFVHVDCRYGYGGRRWKGN